MEVTLIATDQKKKKAPALFDSGSFYTLVRSDCLPSPAAMLHYRAAKKLGTAKKGTQLHVTGTTELIIHIGQRRILAHVLVSPNLAREAIIGAETMQAWDISIRNRNEKTRVVVGRDMRDPDISEVDSVAQNKREGL